MTLQLALDEKWLAASGLAPDDAQREFRLLLAAKLFELGRVTLGQAAELAGLPTWDFSEALGRIGVSVINLTPDQLAHDLASA
jgi:predicted HTH domain antitoxin